MSDLAYRIRLRAGAALKAVTRRPFARQLSPYRDSANPPVLVHCCYHKVGTVWFGRILREVAAEYGLRLEVGRNYRSIHKFETCADSDVFIDNGSHLNLSAVPKRCKISHMIRDPRDMIVSGYFYHRWTDEPWANLERAEFRGMTYREYLNSVSKDEGLAAEIRRNSFWIPHMASWKFGRPSVFEIRYEDIIEDEGRIFSEMFHHFEFREDAVDRAINIAKKYSFETMKSRGGSGGGSHLRSGRSGEWREHFSDDHKELFRSLYPGALTSLGYESSDDW